MNLYSDLLEKSNLFEKAASDVAPHSLRSLDAEPISIKPVKNVDDEIVGKFKRINPVLSAYFLEKVQSELINTIYSELNSKGYNVSKDFIKSQIFSYGSNFDGEVVFFSSLDKNLSNYSNKVIHYIMNNLSF